MKIMNTWKSFKVTHEKMQMQCCVYCDYIDTPMTYINSSMASLRANTVKWNLQQVLGQ